MYFMIVFVCFYSRSIDVMFRVGVSGGASLWSFSINRMFLYDSHCVNCLDKAASWNSYEFLPDFDVVSSKWQQKYSDCLSSFLTFNERRWRTRHCQPHFVCPVTLKSFVTSFTLSTEWQVRGHFKCSCNTEFSSKHRLRWLIGGISWGVWQWGAGIGVGWERFVGGLPEVQKLYG